MRGVPARPARAVRRTMIAEKGNLIEIFRVIKYKGRGRAERARPEMNAAV